MWTINSSKICTGVLESCLLARRAPATEALEQDLGLRERAQARGVGAGSTRVAVAASPSRAPVVRRYTQRGAASPGKHRTPDLTDASCFDLSRSISVPRARSRQAHACIQDVYMACKRRCTYDNTCVSRTEWTRQSPNCRRIALQAAWHVWVGPCVQLTRHGTHHCDGIRIYRAVGLRSDIDVFCPRCLGIRWCDRHVCSKLSAVAHPRLCDCHDDGCMCMRGR